MRVDGVYRVAWHRSGGELSTHGEENKYDATEDITARSRVLTRCSFVFPAATGYDATSAKEHEV